MSGEQQQRRRLTILRALLSNMTDEQRLQITAKLCHDVLAIVPDGQLSLEASHWVIADALLLLACKEIKLRSINPKRQAVTMDPLSTNAPSLALAVLLALAASTKKRWIPHRTQLRQLRLRRIGCYLWLQERQPSRPLCRWSLNSNATLNSNAHHSCVISFSSCARCVHCIAFHLTVLFPSI